MKHVANYTRLACQERVKEQMQNNTQEDIIEIEFPIKSGDFVAAGDASSKTKKLLKQLGIDPEIIRRAAIACYEAELNLVIHSLGGSLILTITPSELVIKTQDIGPGISDVDLDMQEGYTTASDSARELGFGAGMRSEEHTSELQSRPHLVCRL